MTIASQISRLQTDKECIRQAIIDKGVNVASNLTLDSYAACIAAIPSLPKQKYAKYLVVGGGGGGGRGIFYYGGGGGGEVLYGETELLNTSYAVTVGAGGAQQSCGCYSNFDTICAKGGNPGGECNGGASGSGCSGGGTNYALSAGGGGGAGGVGCSGVSCNGGAGGVGVCGYGGGGGGSSYRTTGGRGCDGGGNGSDSYGDGGDATGCGGGGGGGSNNHNGGKGGNGIVEICYKTDGCCGFVTATGGNSCFICDGYRVHRFTSNGTFTIVS